MYNQEPHQPRFEQRHFTSNGIQLAKREKLKESYCPGTHLKSEALALNFIRNRMRTVFGNRRAAKRYLPSSSLEIVARLSLVDTAGLAILGRVKNLNEIGIMLEVGSCKVDDHDLGAMDARIEIILALPRGTIQIKATPIYCRPLDPNELETGSLLGIKITAMSREDEVQYREFLRSLG